MRPKGGKVGIVSIKCRCDTGRFLSEIREVVTYVVPVGIVVQEKSKYSGGKSPRSIRRRGCLELTAVGTFMVVKGFTGLEPTCLPQLPTNRRAG